MTTKKTEKAKPFEENIGAEVFAEPEQAAPADVGMADLLIEGQEVEDQPAAKADPAPDDGEPNNDKPVNFVPGDNLPPDIYYSAGDAELERLLPYLIGTASTKRIKELALGRNVRPVAVLRQGILVADELGAFDPIGATEKRTGNDNRMDHGDSMKMRAVLSEPVFQVVLKMGRERCVSNRAALYFGVVHALQVAAI